MNEELNVLIFAKTLEHSGVERYVCDLVKKLISKGINVSVVSNNNYYIADTKTRSYSIKILSFNPMRIIKNVLVLHNIIVDNNIKIVHCQHKIAIVYMLIYNLFWKKPYICTIHSSPNKVDISLAFLCKRVNKIIAVSKETYDILVEKYHVTPNKLKIILNGVNEFDFHRLSVSEKICARKKKNIPINNTVFLMHSRISKEKNHINVIKAISCMPKDEREMFTLLITGDPKGKYYEKIKEYINLYGLNKQIIFCGWCQSKEIIGLSDVLLLPSTKEGFAFSCVEAMLMGISVIRSKTGGYEEMSDFVTGLENTEPNAILKCIEDVLHNGTSLSKYLDKAREFAIAKFSLEKMVEETIDLYRTVLEEDHHKQPFKY